MNADFVFEDDDGGGGGGDTLRKGKKLKTKKDAWSVANAVGDVARVRQAYNATSIDEKIEARRKSKRGGRGGGAGEEASGTDGRGAGARDDEDIAIKVNGDRIGGRGARGGDGGGRVNVKRQKPPASTDSSDDDSDDDEDDGDYREQHNIGADGGEEAEGGGGGDGSVRVVEQETLLHFESASGVRYDLRSFEDLELSKPLLRAVEQLGFSKPTPIQSAVVPLALAGRDIAASATTGSGKTAAYALPLLERLLHRSRKHPMIHVLVLVPTRELAVQVQSMMSTLGEFTDVRVALVVGGLSASVQMASLRSEPEVVIATPGRLIDHLHNARDFGLEDLSVLVLDEADRLLELGFKEELRELLRMCPRQRQTMLFSATMTDEVRRLADLSLTKPVRLAADPREAVPGKLKEEVVRIRNTGSGGGGAAEKEPTLLALCTRSFKSGTIIFTQTKQQAHRLKIVFGLAGLRAAELHGNLTQAMRLEALDAFRRGDAAFLIATNVAARGLDILGVRGVINFDAPRTLTEYLHRVGRTARAGRDGHSVTLVEERDRALLKLIVKRAGGKIQQRSVATGAVAEMRAKIDSFSDDIIAIHVEEREEKALRKAEMEATKAMNMVEHEAEIFSRPKKVWFQTEREKRAAAKAAKDAAENETVGGVANGVGGKQTKRAASDGGKDAANKKQKRPKSAEEEMDEADDARAYMRAKAIKAAANRLRGTGARSSTADREANRDAKVAQEKKRAAKTKAKLKANGVGAGHRGGSPLDSFFAKHGEAGIGLMGSRGEIAAAAADATIPPSSFPNRPKVKKKGNPKRGRR